jgi:hypothetical protein
MLHVQPLDGDGLGVISGLSRRAFLPAFFQKGKSKGEGTARWGA